MGVAKVTVTPTSAPAGSATGSSNGSVWKRMAPDGVSLPAVNGTGDFRKLTTVLHGETVPDVYAMMILGFQVWWVVAFYLVAQWMLFNHLGHGLASMFQSLGLRNHVWWPRVQGFAKLASIAIFIGYAIIPISIFLRIVGADYAEKAKHQFSQSSPPAAALVAEVNGKEAK